MVVTLTAAYSTQTDSAAMVAATGWTGKTSAQADITVMASSILTLTRMENGNDYRRYYYI